ncbi:MAG: TolC family protein [Candidatus Hydrogenedentes bacterium]|nr:TolC family protein [Candidatus Hydrogenedentota bacterium]
MLRIRLIVVMLAACAGMAFADDAATPNASPEPQAPAAASEPVGPVTSEAIIEMMKSLEEFMAQQPADVPKGDPLVLDARKAVELATTQNAQVYVAEDDVDAAKARIGQARSRLLPQITVSSTQTWTEFNERDQGFLQELIYGGSIGGGGLGGGSGLGGGGLGGGLGGGSNSSIPGSRIARFVLGRVLTDLLDVDSMLERPDDFRTDKMTINQVIYAGGQIKSAVRASQYLAESQEFRQQGTLAQLEFDAKQAYYTAAASQALVRVAEESVKTFERQLNDTRQMFDVGMVSNFEVLRSETELGSRKSTLVQARNGQRLAFANLCRVIGAPQDTPLTLDTKFDYVPMTQDLDSLVAFAYEHRPEILALKKGIDAGKEDVKRVRGQYKPQVAGNIQWQNVDNGGLTQPDGWTFSVGGQWDIATGGRRKYERIETKARLSGLEHQLQDLQAIVELDVKAAQIQIQDAMARVSSERGTRELAREGLRLAELRFQEGAGTQTETLDAELALTSADTALVQALRDYAVANSSLERAIGKSWVRDGEPDVVTDIAPAEAEKK